ncbi:hypothetical protein TNIN_168811 [Trichonephila inaurata madagascariensis]|uniref:Uncharacterized protein n=1 Tax=Trichonephila inaurata madagascariensis TaxID=2747483 RepID=A0A8X6I632_9ARAC|nr:hypothetical protein TNIN_168811 [Trichonephila inaurata madagascariensis]
MKNAAGWIKEDLSELYILLESKLIALESLGRTIEKFANSWSHWLRENLAYRKPCYVYGKEVAPWKILHRKTVRARWINYFVFFGTKC